MTGTLLEHPTLLDTTQSEPAPAVPRTTTPAPSALRSAGVTFAGPGLLNLFLAAGAVATAFDPLLGPAGSGPGRLLRRVAGAGAVAAWAYTLAARPWFLRWGAVDDELDRAYPGDAIVPHATWRSTRAITINAPAEAVWPWLVQFGHGRGGFYSYDWLENLAGLDIHSTDQILPQHQELKIGQFVPGGPGEPEQGGGWTVVGIEPGHALILRVGAPTQAFEPVEKVPFVATWAFVIEPVDETSSRLVFRWRATSWRRAFVVAVMALTELPHFIMERKMLLGIKRRAEAMARR